MVPTAFLGHPASTELCTLTEVIMLRIYMYTLSECQISCSLVPVSVSCSSYCFLANHNKNGEFFVDVT